VRSLERSTGRENLMNSTLIDAIIEERRPPNKFLSEMKMVIPWQRIRVLLEKEIVRSGRGRPSYDLILMFKMLLVKTWYNLSDEGTEFQIRDRLSFKEFCELNMMDKVPDASCLEDFRHMIEKHELMSKLLDLVNEQCEEKGLLLRKGNIVDASFIEANCTPSKKADRSDPEAQFGHKGFGYSAHVNADEDSKLIIKINTTAANTPDYKGLEGILDEKTKECMMDRGYDYPEAHQKLEKIECVDFIMKKKKKGKELSLFDKIRNKAISSVRCRVEHIFGVWDNTFKFFRASYRGLKKVKAQIETVALAYNFKRIGFLVRGLAWN
jgi:IS5 family transposase